MESFEEDTQVFIVRFWHETREAEGAHPIWRGSVEHVPSSRRVYVKNIKEVEEVMALFLPGTEKSRTEAKWINRLK